jgi:hypothetical protein
MRTWGSPRATQQGRYTVELSTDPTEPPMGELFVMQAVLRDREGQLLEQAKVKLDARMPQHNHGMATDPIDDPGVCTTPTDCRHPGGVYRTAGFKFHMPGEWTVSVEILGPEGQDSTTVIYLQR